LLQNDGAPGCPWSHPQQSVQAGAAERHIQGFAEAENIAVKRNRPFHITDRKGNVMNFTDSHSFLLLFPF
jgi:hypothetical protein